MPMESDSRRRRREPGVVVGYSAAVELTWILMSVLGKHTSSDEAEVAALRAEHPELVARVASFWEDGAWWGELLVIADRTGTFLETDPSSCSSACSRASATGRSASRPRARPTARPCSRGSSDCGVDARLRKRYVALLRELWAAAEGRFGSPADAEATVVAWRERLAAGAGPAGAAARQARCAPARVGAVGSRRHAGGDARPLARALLPRRPHRRRRPDAVRRRLRDEQDSLAVRRFYAGEVASRLKVLSDPTRVALLSQLACEPMSVTELAALYDLAQPTVSIHVRQLREAGLVVARKEGGRTIYSVPHDRVQGSWTRPATCCCASAARDAGRALEAP